MLRRFLCRVAPLAAALALAACGSTREYSGGFADPEVLDPGKNMQCVPFARAESGVDIRGDASTWWQQAREQDYDTTDEPSEGAVMVLRGYKDSSRGHVAVVRRVENDREIVIDHANWLNDGKIYLDQPVMDVSDDNDWSRVRVWYAPGRTYGARIYTVQGFILPRTHFASAAAAGS